MSAGSQFLLQRDALDAQFYLVNAGPRWAIQMNILTGIFGISLLLNLLSIGLRLRDGNAWSHRIHQNVRGRFYVPNSVISWLITSTIFDGLVQGYLLSCRRYAIVGSDLTNGVRWRAFTFLPLWIGAWLQGWAAMVAPLLNREQRRAPSFWQASIFINSLCLGPVLLAVALVPLGMVSNDHYNQAYYAYRGIRLLLSSAISGGDVDLSAMKALGQVIEAESQSAIAWLEYVWIVWAIATALMLLLYTTAATIHFLGLSSEMKLLAASPSSNRRQLRSLKRSFSSLVFTTAAILIGGLSEFVMIIVLATNTEQIAKGGLFGELIMLLTLWVIALLIGAVGIVIFFRSVTFFRHPTTSNAASTSITTLPSTLISRVSSPPPASPDRPPRPPNLFIGSQAIRMEDAAPPFSEGSFVIPLREEKVERGVAW